MEKIFSLERSFVNVKDNPNFCVNCSNIATKEVLFNVDGAVILEKYCDTCTEKEVK